VYSVTGLYLYERCRCICIQDVFLC